MLNALNNWSNTQCFVCKHGVRHCAVFASGESDSTVYQAAMDLDSKLQNFAELLICTVHCTAPSHWQS